MDPYAVDTAAMAGMSVVTTIISLVIGVFAIICMWKIFTKAGKPGWASIVPIYNFIVMLQIAKKPLWYIVMFFIPGVNIVFMILFYLAFLEEFGQPGWHIVLLLFFNVFYFAYLAFSSKVEYLDN